MAQVVKNLPAMQETQVRSLGWEDPLEKGMATYSRILAWRIPWTEESEGLQSMWSQKIGHDWVTNTFTLLLYLECEPYDLYDIQSMTTYFKSRFKKKTLRIEIVVRVLSSKRKKYILILVMQIFISWHSQVPTNRRRDSINKNAQSIKTKGSCRQPVCPF